MRMLMAARRQRRDPLRIALLPCCLGAGRIVANALSLTMYRHLEKVTYGKTGISTELGPVYTVTRRP